MTFSMLVNPLKNEYLAIYGELLEIVETCINSYQKKPDEAILTRIGEIYETAEFVKSEIAKL